MMTLKSKKMTALILTAFLAASALSGCDDGNSLSDSSPAAAENSISQVSQNATQPDNIQTIKDTIAEEAQATNNEINLTVWCSGEETDFTENVLAEFQQMYEDSRYTFHIQIENIGEDKAEGKLLEGPQDGADVFFFPSEFLDDLKEYLSPVSDIYKDKVTEENSSHAVSCAVYQDILYGFPKTPYNQCVLFYDKRVLSEEDVQSLDTMIEKSAGQNKNVLFNLENTFYSTNVFLTAGITMHYKDGQQYADFDSQQGLNAAKAICRLVQQNEKGIITSAIGVGMDTYVNEWELETISAQIALPEREQYIVNAIGSENLGVAKLPTILIDGKEVQMQCLDGYSLAGVNSYTKYPMTAQTLAYALTDENAQYQRYINAGIIPTNKNIIETDSAVQNDPVQKAIAEQSPYTQIYHETIGGNYFTSGITDFVKYIEGLQGDVSDTELQEKLKEIQNQLKN